MKKYSLLPIFMIVVLLLSACTKEQKVTDDMVMKNEIEYFEAVTLLSQMIQRTNQLYMVSEGILANNDIQLYKDLKENVDEEIKAIDALATDAEEKINNFTVHTDNEEYNKGLKVVQGHLLKGIKEYKESREFIDEELIALIKSSDVTTEEDMKAIYKTFEDSFVKHEIQFKGNIEQMTNAFDSANQSFVLEIGKFKKGYTKDTFSENISKYFQEEAAKMEEENKTSKQTDTNKEGNE